jgi:error-prone DNA polymerase
MAQLDAERIVQARGDRRFGSFREFTQRTGIGRAALMRLSQADVFGSLGRGRRQALWEAMAQERSVAKDAVERPLFEMLTPTDDPIVDLPQATSLEEVFADYDITGLSLKAHPISFYRPHLTELQVTPHMELADLQDQQQVRIAGLVLLRQRPSTAKGITFVTLEDETGTANLVLHPRTWERHYPIARRSPAWIAEGKLENRKGVIHLVVEQLWDLADELKQCNPRSRDFR